MKLQKYTIKFYYSFVYGLINLIYSMPNHLKAQLFDYKFALRVCDNEKEIHCLNDAIFPIKLDKYEKIVKIL